MNFRQIIKAFLITTLVMVLSIFTAVQGQAASDTSQIQVDIAEEQSDIILIPTSNLIYTPAKNQPSVFGVQSLVFKVMEPRITSGTCNFRLKPYAAEETEFATNSPKLTVKVTPYNTSTGCQTSLPANQQNVPRWDLEIRITDTNTGKIYGADPSYFMLYGAIGVVTISGRPL
jgi:hypothetical protein